MPTYSIRPWYDKYIIVRTEDSFRPMYVKRFRNSRAVWTWDPLYAKQYALSTAEKHIRDLDGWYC